MSACCDSLKTTAQPYAVDAFTLRPLITRFEDTGPLDPTEIDQHAATIADILTNGLKLNPPDRSSSDRASRAE